MSSAEQQNEFIDTDDERDSPTEIVQESVDQAVEDSPTEIVQESVEEAVQDSPTEIVQESVEEAVEDSPTEIVKEIPTKTNVIRDSTSSTFHQYISK